LVSIKGQRAIACHLRSLFSSRSGVIHSNIKAEYIRADQPVTIICRLRQGGGPYIVLGLLVAVEIIRNPSAPGRNFHRLVEILTYETCNSLV
jgi:hypothetical protein